MSNQLSSIGFGSDINVIAGYALSANDRLGNIDFIFENTGDNDAVIVLKEALEPSGFAQVGSVVTVAAGGGTVTKSYSLLSSRVAFMGSGDTIVNISSVIRNKGNLRGAQISILPVGRRQWGFNEAFDVPAFRPLWGIAPDSAEADALGHPETTNPDNNP